MNSGSSLDLQDIQTYSYVIQNKMLIRLTLQMTPGRLLRREHLETLQAEIASSLEPQCLIQHLNIYDSTHPIG